MPFGIQYMGPGGKVLPDFNISETLFKKGKYYTEPENQFKGDVSDYKDYPNSYASNHPEVLGTSNVSYDKYPSPIGPVQQITDGGGSGSNGGGYDSEEAQRQAEEERQRQLQEEVDNIYGDIMNSVGKMRDRLFGSKPDVMRSAELPYLSQIPLIEQARDEGIGNLTNLQNETSMMADSALDAARRLYSELSQRNQQAFGGGRLSSLGQAAGELLGREQMRQMGDIRQGLTTQISNIGMEMQNVRDRANAKLQEVELKRQNALANAELWFNEQLAQIEAIENQTQQNKATDKLNLLRQFQEQVANENALAEYYKQQVSLQASQDQSYLQQVLGETSGYGSGALQRAGTGVQQYGQDISQGMQEMNTNNQVNTGGQTTYNPYLNISGNYRTRDEYEDIMSPGQSSSTYSVRD